MSHVNDIAYSFLPLVQYYTEKEIQSYAQPSSIHTCPRVAGQRLAASYVNYYLANQAIILPQFGDHVYDARAKEVLEDIFPKKTIVGVYSREILLGGGNIHCITQQVPLPLRYRME